MTPTLAALITFGIGLPMADASHCWTFLAQWWSDAVFCEDEGEALTSLNLIVELSTW